MLVKVGRKFDHILEFQWKFDHILEFLWKFDHILEFLWKFDHIFGMLAKGRGGGLFRFIQYPVSGPDYIIVAQHQGKRDTMRILSFYHTYPICHVHQNSKRSAMQEFQL